MNHAWKALGLVCVTALSVTMADMAKAQTQLQQTDNTAGALSTTGDDSLNPSATVQQTFEGSEATDSVQTVPNAVAPSHSPSMGSPNTMQTFWNIQYPCIGPNGQIILLSLQGGANTPQYSEIDGGSLGFSFLGFGGSGGYFDGTTEIRPAEEAIYAGQLEDAQQMAGISLAQCSVLSDPNSEVGIATREVLTSQALQMAGIYDQVLDVMASQDVVLQNARQLVPHVMRELNQLILLNNDNSDAIAQIQADLNTVNAAMIDLSRYSRGETSADGSQIDPDAEYSVILAIYDSYVSQDLIGRHLAAFPAN